MKNAHSQEAPPPSEQDRLPLKQKLAFGVGQLGGQLQSGTDDRLLLPVFVNALHVSPALISTLMMVYRIWDGVTDILMGWVSDGTRSRWGRRRPYLFTGCLLSALFLPTFWLLDPTWDMRTIIIWMIVGQLLLILANTIWNIPYQSMLFELTPSSVERTNIAAVRSYFGKSAGLALAWVWWLTQLPIFAGPDGKPDVVRGAFWVSVGIAVIVLSCGMTTAIFSRERYYHAAIKAPRVSLWSNLRMTLTNRSFLCLAGILLFFVLGTRVTDTLIFYARLYYVASGDSELAARLAGISGTLELIVGIAIVPVVQWSCRRFGKRAMLIFFLSVIGISGASTWFTYNPSYPYLSITTAVVLYPATNAIWLIVASVTGDVVDDEELKSGTRREGSFAAVFSWLFKLYMSVSLALGGVLVVWVGFDPKFGAAQVEGVMTGVRLSLVVTSVIFTGVAVFIASRFPLTTRRIEEIRAELEARRGAL